MQEYIGRFIRQHKIIDQPVIAIYYEFRRWLASQLDCPPEAIYRVTPRHQFEDAVCAQGYAVDNRNGLKVFCRNPATAKV